MMLMLAVSRRLIWQHANVSGGRWRGNGPAPRMYEMFDKTLGIVGLGTIGKKVARLAQAFGMRVQYYDIARLSEDAEDALGVRFRLLRELLRTSDVVSLHVPLNDSTRHMIGAGELALMKPTAILVNTCRGPVVDEAALHRALSDRQALRRRPRRVRPGAAAADNPLLKLDNVRADGAFRRADLGQPRRALPQRVRQRAARRSAASRRCGWCRNWRTCSPHNGPLLSRRTPGTTVGVGENPRGPPWRAPSVCRATATPTTGPGGSRSSRASSPPRASRSNTHEDNPKGVAGRVEDFSERWKESQLQQGALEVYPVCEWGAIERVQRWARASIIGLDTTVRTGAIMVRKDSRVVSPRRSAQRADRRHLARRHVLRGDRGDGGGRRAVRRDQARACQRPAGRAAQRQDRGGRADGAAGEPRARRPAAASSPICAGAAASSPSDDVDDETAAKLRRALNRAVAWLRQNEERSRDELLRDLTPEQRKHRHDAGAGGRAGLSAGRIQGEGRLDDASAASSIRRPPTTTSCAASSRADPMDAVTRPKRNASAARPRPGRRAYPDLHDHIRALEAAGLLVRVDRAIDKDTEMHPLVRWQFRGGIAERDRKAFLFTNVVDAKGRRYDIPVAGRRAGGEPRDLSHRHRLPAGGDRRDAGCAPCQARSRRASSTMRRARRSSSRAQPSTGPATGSTACRCRSRRPASTSRPTPRCRSSSPATPTPACRTWATTAAR